MNIHAATIIERLGGTAEVARLFRVRMPSVSGWKEHGIPKARMLYIEAVHARVLDGVDAVAATSVAEAKADAAHSWPPVVPQSTEQPA